MIVDPICQDLKRILVIPLRMKFVIDQGVDGIEEKTESLICVVLEGDLPPVNR